MIGRAEQAPLFSAGVLADRARGVLRSPALIPGLALALALASVFHGLFAFLPELWGSKDGYYAHGPLVPLISAYLIWKRWPKLSTLAIKPGWWAVVPLVIVLWTARVAASNDIFALQSICLILTLLFGAAFVAGGRWMLALAGPILFLAFGLPLFSSVIENTTNPLQLISTKVAFQLIRLMGFEAFQDGPMHIYLNSFSLNVDVPCSGLKLLLALSAFAAFFVMAARLPIWGSAVLVAIVLPLAVFINGLRIALIGAVGETQGHDAGMAFHDWSGYLTLGLCFFILFKVARLLGWKD